MDSIRTAKGIAILVATSGLVEMLAWLFGIRALTSVLPSMVTMKFTTAVSFFLCGVALYFIAVSLAGRASVAQAVLPATALLIMLIMATLLASALFGLKTGIEDIFVEEGPSAVKTTVPGRPSLVTMADFIAVSIAALAAMFKGGRQKKILASAGVLLIASGVLAIAGYALGAEYLYFAWPGVSTGMALPTAVLFVALGWGLKTLSGAAP